MNKIPSNIMTFAVSQYGRAVHIDEVSNGAQCGCICPACKSPLIAKNGGEERAHHFAHDGRVENNFCSETALHFAAKQIVADNMTILLPSEAMWGLEGGSIINFSQVVLEHRLETNLEADHHIVADCFGICASQSIIIEIAVHHEVDQIKLNKLQTLNLPSIEIVLTDFTETSWNWKSLTHEVLFAVQRRKWLWQPEEQVVEAAPVNPVTIVDQREWIFDIGGHFVWVKKLPHANIKIFHRPSDYVRKIVQPLCQNKGFWNPKYNCWVVFDKFRDELLKSLSESGKLCSPSHQ